MKIHVNQLGFTPEDTKKQAIVEGDEKFTEFSVVCLNETGYNEIGPNGTKNQYAFTGKLQKFESAKGNYYIADFSSVDAPGFYLITVNDEYNSVPFQIRDDVYTRTMRKAFDYIHIQRCGTAVEGYHGPCHLDDGIKRENGEYLDTTGGWHDAGDLRKWMAHTMLLGVGISQIKRRVDPLWNSFGGDEGDLLTELRWGNTYFLKMLDSTGRVYSDVGAGLNGDNSDNHWTDNVIGSKDDRFIATDYHPEIQWEFIYLEAMISGFFKDTDSDYAEKCLAASKKAHGFFEKNPEYKLKCTAWTMLYSPVKYVAWSVLAYKELYKATNCECYLAALKEALETLLTYQETDYAFGQKIVRGFFYADSKKDRVFKELRDSGIILIALCEVYPLLDENSELKAAAKRAIEMYCDDFVTPLVKTNPYGIMPYGLYIEDLTDETYHLLGGKLKYRLFSPTKVDFYQGLDAHLLSHAVGLHMAGTLFNKSEWKQTAKNQVEWVMGKNPDNSCLMTGEGCNNPYPHSRFLGLIPGGIMNGYIGTEDDEPYLDLNYQMDWRTCEYWSPHTCFYLWYLSLL